MDVTLSGRMGGSETGVRFVAAVVMHRRRLKAALAPLQLAGLATLDITLHVGGSISDYIAQAPRAQARYQRAKQALSAAIYVPRPDAETVAEADADRALGAWGAGGIDSFVPSAGAASLDLSALRQAISATA